MVLPWPANYITSVTAGICCKTKSVTWQAVEVNEYFNRNTHTKLIQTKLLFQTGNKNSDSISVLAIYCDYYNTQLQEHDLSCHSNIQIQEPYLTCHSFLEMETVIENPICIGTSHHIGSSNTLIPKIMSQIFIQKSINPAQTSVGLPSAFGSIKIICIFIFLTATVLHFKNKPR